MRLTSVAALLLAVGCSACFTTQTVTKPSDELKVEPGAFPHGVFDKVLKATVNEIGQVDYKQLAANRGELEQYLFAIQSYSPHSHADLFPLPQDKLTYWINAYNAYVLFAVTLRPEMESVVDDKTDFFYFTKYKFGTEEWSLYQLENEIVRKEFTEPRIHMALNCASGGCPELPAEAFLPANLEAQLTREAGEFCKHPKKVRFDGDKVSVSEIFKFYEDDFKPDGGPVGFCRKWGNEALPAGAEFEYLPYDWTLNAQPGKALFD